MPKLIWLVFRGQLSIWDIDGDLAAGRSSLSTSCTRDNPVHLLLAGFIHRWAGSGYRDRLHVDIGIAETILLLIVMLAIAAIKKWTSSRITASDKRRCGRALGLEGTTRKCLPLLPAGAGAGNGLVGISLLTRMIGPANYGIFTAAFAAVILLVTLTEWGRGVYLVRLRARRTRRVPSSAYFAVAVQRLRNRRWFCRDTFDRTHFLGSNRWARQ